MGEMKEISKTENVMENFKSITGKLAHTVACIAMIPFLPMIAIMWVVALTYPST